MTHVKETNIKEKFSCIILAGGEGKRVDGRDKGLILYQGKFLVQHVIDTITPQVQDIIISANRNIAQYEKLGYKVVSDLAQAQQGPLSGIAASLPHCNNERVLIVPCDMPHLPTDTIEKLANNTAEKNIYIAQTNKKLQLTLLINKALLPSIIHSLENNERRLIRWAKSQHPEIINFQDANAFVNYNYSSDFD